MTKSLLIRCALVLMLGLCSACSSFDRQWKHAAAGGGGATRWDGRWTSEKHRKSDGSPEGGRLRCVLEPIEAQKLAAHFHANYLVFSANYSVTLEPVLSGPRRNKSREFRGTQQLPAAFGGTYHYEASMAGDHFTCRYTSSYDHGTFTLQRVPLDVKLHAQH